MANYNLVINSKFKPFSFEELLRPAIMATQAHYAIEDELANYSSKSGNIGSRIKDNEVVAKGLYDKYQKDLSNMVDILASTGVAGINRRERVSLKRRFDEEIGAIERAYNRRLQLIDEQRKLEGDSTMMFSKDATNMTLDELMADPTLDYEYLSGAQITNRVAKALQNYKTQLLKKDRLGTWKSTAGGQLLERIETRGLTREDIIEIEKNPEAFPEIQKIINDAVASTGVDSWENPKALAMAKMYAYEGLPYGLGEVKRELRDNKNFISALDRWKIRQAREQANPKAPAGTTLRPWGLELVNKNLNDGYKSLLFNLVAPKYGKGLNVAYAGKSFTNPLKIKEEYERYAKTHIKKETRFVTHFDPSKGGGVQSYKEVKVPNYGLALKYIQNKYGVSKILTDSEYEAAKYLGFTNRSTFEEMAGDNIKKRIDASVLATSPTSLNLTDYKYVTDIMAPNLGSMTEDRQKGFAFELTDGLKKGKGETYEDVFGPKTDEDGNPRNPTPIKDVSYSAQHPNMLIITTDKRHLVNPAMMGQTWVNAIKDNTQGISMLSNELKGGTQLMVASLIQNLANVKQGIPGETTTQH